jgi:energy-coupling factor transport system substrate-specific component
VGLAARKNKLDTMFGTMTVAFMTPLVAIAVAVPLNVFFHGGSTGNMWGDGVIAFLQRLGVPFIPSCIAGQFYVEFLDKLACLLILYYLLHLVRWLRARREQRKGKKPEETAAKVLSALLILFLACSASVLSARAERGQDTVNYNDYVQTVYSSSNGLPCGEANDIVQTNDGILWVGTYAGLYRYNGREFKWMDGYESVRNVNCLYVDEEGRLWIGTNDNGLSISINGKITNVIDQAKGLPSNSVRSIIQSTEGYYYIGTTGSMQILTLNSGLKVVNTLWEINYADHIAADDKGHVAAVTSNGRLFLLRGSQILSSRQLPGAGEIFKCCRFDPDGYLLAGTTNGHIYLFDIREGGFDEVTVFTCGNLTSLKDLYFLDSGEMFVTADNGVGYLDANRAYHSVNTNQFNNSIDKMLVDYQGNLWFTSSRLGLLRLAASDFRDIYSTAGMEKRVVNTVAQWNGVYYIGTDKGMDAVDQRGMNRVQDKITERFSGVRIRCMTVDDPGHLWVCTYGDGLVEFDPDGTEYVYNRDNGAFGNRARVVTQLNDGTILAAGDTGLS